MRLPLTRCIFLLLIIPKSAFAQHDLTNAEIPTWNRKRLHYETKFIEGSVWSLKKGDSIVVMPIGFSILQYDYDSSAVLNVESTRVEMLIRMAIDRLFGLKWRLVSPKFSASDEIKVKTIIDATLTRLKLNRFASFRIEDRDFPDAGGRFLMVPYLTWTRTIENFDPKKKRNIYLGGASYDTRSYTWREAKAFLFIIDMNTHEIVYYSYKFWSGGLPGEPEQDKILRMFKRCGKALMRNRKPSTCARLRRARLNLEPGGSERLRRNA